MFTPPQATPTKPYGGYPGKALVLPSSRLVHTGGYPPPATSFGNDSTPVLADMYLAEVIVPSRCLVTGIALFNGSVAAGNVIVGLFDNNGYLVAQSNPAGVAMAGTTAYQRVPFYNTAASANAPADVVAGTYYVGVIYTSTSARFRSHIVGDFGAASVVTPSVGVIPTNSTYTNSGEGQSSTPALASVPSTFTTDVGPVASLY